MLYLALILCFVVDGAGCEHVVEKRASPTLFSALGASLHGLTNSRGNVLSGKYLLPNSSVTASSVIYSDPTFDPSLGAGRLNGSRPWKPTKNTNYEFLQISFPHATVLKYVATRGGGNYGGFVSSYRLEHSMDGYDWFTYTGAGTSAVTFSGNVDANGTVWHELVGQWGQHPVSLGLVTKHVRLHPLTWAQDVPANLTGGIALRLEVLRKVECGDGFWDLAFEGCDDGNLESGDGCSGSITLDGKVGAACVPERHSSIYGRMTTDGQGYQQGTPQPYLTGSERTLTTIHSHFNQNAADSHSLMEWCNQGSPCDECIQQSTASAQVRMDEATGEFFTDPLHYTVCAGRAAGETPVPQDDGRYYRTMDPRNAYHLPPGDRQRQK